MIKMSLSDIVDANEYGREDLVTKADLVTSKYDYGVGKLFTGVADASIIGTAGALTGVSASSIYSAMHNNLPIYSNVLYELAFPLMALGTGIGYGLANTNKQKIAPGIAAGALVAYSGYQSLNSVGVPLYYLFSGAGIASGLTSSVVVSAVAPVAVLFGAGWVIASAYKLLKSRKARKSKKK